MIDREVLRLTFESFMLSFKRFISLIKGLDRTADSEEGDESDGLLESMEMCHDGSLGVTTIFHFNSFSAFRFNADPFSRLHIFTSSSSSPPSHDQRSRENKHLVSAEWRV